MLLNFVRQPSGHHVFPIADITKRQIVGFRFSTCVRRDGRNMNWLLRRFDMLFRKVCTVGEGLLCAADKTEWQIVTSRFSSCVRGSVFLLNLVLVGCVGRWVGGLLGCANVRALVACSLARLLACSHARMLACSLGVGVFVCWCVGSLSCLHARFGARTGEEGRRPRCIRRAGLGGG